MAKITLKSIRKELELLMREKKKGLTSQKEINNAVNRARQEINVKYGTNWRQRFKTNHKQSYDFDKPSMAQDLGPEWDDYAWGADDY